MTIDECLAEMKSLVADASENLGPCYFKIEVNSWEFDRNKYYVYFEKALDLGLDLHHNLFSTYEDAKNFFLEVVRKNTASKQAQMNDLAAKAKIAATHPKECTCVTCNEINAAIKAIPSVDLPF